MPRSRQPHRRLASSHSLEPGFHGKLQPGAKTPRVTPTPQPRWCAAGTTLSTHLLGFRRTAGGRPGGGGAVKSSSMSFRVTLFLRSNSASWRVILFSKPIRSNIERSVS